MNAISRNIEATWESTASHEDLLAQAIASGVTTPTRRYRLEGTPVGNSKLLTKEEAGPAQQQYGGGIVEVIPLAACWTAKAADLPACSREGCGAAAGAPCYEGTPPKICAPHRNRTRTSEPEGEYTKLGKCPHPGCPAAKGEVCRNKEGKPQRPHAVRLGKPLKVSKAATLAACGKCQRAAGQTCVDDQGRPCAPHKGRVAIAETSEETPT